MGTHVEVEKEYLSPHAQLTASLRGVFIPIRSVLLEPHTSGIGPYSALQSLSPPAVQDPSLHLPRRDHYRTRLTHVLEVAQISRTVARALGLNEDLTKPLLWGMIWATSFGHAGEAALAQLVGHFRHNEQSLRVVDVLEEHSPHYPGLNLTAEVRDGILRHTGPELPATLEGQVVRICDRIAYLNHDVETRCGEVSSPKVTCPGASRRFWAALAERIDTMVQSVIEASLDKPCIAMDPDVAAATDELREFLFAHVYVGSEAKLEESKVYGLIEQLFNYYMSNRANWRSGGPQRARG